MPRVASTVFPFEIRLDRSSAVTLDRQIADAIRSAILSGELLPGDHLPAIRTLAAQVGVARATLDAAYGILVQEGWITATPGRGSFVSREPPKSANFEKVPTIDHDPETLPPKNLNLEAHFCERSLSALLPQKNIPLAVVTTSDEMSPGRNFRAITARLAKRNTDFLTYTMPEGLLELREQICKVIGRLRGIKCTPDQIIITSGSQAGFAMCMRLLFNPGDKVWFEDPSYPLMRAAAHFNRIQEINVPVDEHGLVVDEGLRMAPDAKGCFITPSHQCPLGMLMSMSRRRQLLQWAKDNGAWIIEDDYDSELRYGGNLPFPSIQGMDTTGSNVIYIGTFSKMLFPGYRLGYVIVPKSLINIFRGYRLISDRQGNELKQAAVAEYMREGLYEGHVRRMRQGFEERRNLLLKLCQEELSEWGEIMSGDQGMHVVFKFANQSIDDMQVQNACLQEGIEARAISFFYTEQPPIKGLMLGFGFFKSDQIVAAVRRIGFVLRSKFARYQV